MNKIISVAVAAGLLHCAFPGNSFASGPTPRDATLVKGLLTAIEHGDYTTFIAEGDKNFVHLDKARFDSVVAQLSPHLKAGYDLSFIKEGDEAGAHVTRWRLKFKDGAVTGLATLAVKDNLIAGFLVLPGKKGDANSPE
jgi:hypothetical protein